MIEAVHRHDIPPNLNINTRLYIGIKIPRPGNPAFLNTFHREITINIMMAMYRDSHIITIHHRNIPVMSHKDESTSGCIFPVSTASSISKEKSMCCFVNK